MPSSRLTYPRGTLARWSAVAAIGLMGAALLLTVWTTHRDVNDASQTVVRGHANTLEQAIRIRLMDLAAPPTTSDVQAILDEQSASGLRYLVVQEEGSSTLIQAGTALGGPIAPSFAAVPGDRPRSISDGRVRMFFHALQRIPFAAGQEPRRRRFSVAIEFQPIQAESLRAASWRTLGIGGLAATTLLLVTALLVRWTQKREAMAIELERARRLASLGELSAVLAHEIRNPLASLKGNAQLLAGTLPAGDKPRAKADRVVDEAIRLESLVGDLLEFARTGQLERLPRSPAGLLAEAVESLASERVILDVARAPSSWSLDGARMVQALANLLENALQAGEPVRASVSTLAGQLVFEVRDSGPGVPDEDKQRIFEPFYTRRTRGTGLGLAVARRIVEMHGGRISVADAPTGGAVFRISVPPGEGSANAW